MRKLVLIAGLLVAALAVAQIQIVQPGAIATVPALPNGKFVGDTLKLYNSGSASQTITATATLSLAPNSFAAGCNADGGFPDAGPCTYTTLTLASGDSLDLFWDGTQWVLPARVTQNFKAAGTTTLSGAVTISGSALTVTAPTTASATQNSGARFMDGGSQTVTVVTGEHCLCQDTTTAANTCKAPVSSTTATITATTSDTIYYLCL